MTTAKKVTKKVTKKVAKKKVAKKVAKKVTTKKLLTDDQLLAKEKKAHNVLMAKQQKEMKAFQANMHNVGTELAAISKKYKVKFIGIAYDDKFDVGMAMGTGMKSVLERQGMEVELKNLLGLN